MATKTTFTHKNCGGNIVACINAKLVTPNIRISYGKMELGNFEIKATDLSSPDGSTTTDVEMVCIKCKETIPPENVGKEIEVACCVCGELFPLSEVLTTEVFPFICEEDLNNAEVAGSELRKMFNLPTKIKRNSVPTVLGTKIKF